MEFNNVDAPHFSEAEREFAPAQNWSVNGADTLSLWVRGQGPAFAEQADGSIAMSGAGADIWGTADQFRFAYKKLTGNASIVVKVESVDNTNVWAKAGVMIRESLDPSSKFAYVVGTPGSGVSFGWRQVPATACGSATQAGIANPQWVKLTRTGDAFTAQYSADGATWTDIQNADGTVASTPIAMTGEIYIGLCVTSHNAAATANARFSGVKTTGTVTGAWASAAIGVAQPANIPGPLYVMVQDSSGKSKVVTHPDPLVTASTTWQQWQIPLSEFTAAGVKVSSVKKMVIGVDDRTSPVKGGAGMLYLDDIGFGHPAQ
jgi:regulation of enolase protein 1 (concanavalin A-like superfamily)